MKTPIDATGLAVGTTIALINGPLDFEVCDLYEITLSGGGVVRWHSATYDSPVAVLSSLTFNSVTSAGGTYLKGPAISRGKITTQLGTQTATFDTSIKATASDLINGVPVTPFARGRGFDGATLVVYRAYIQTWGITGIDTSIVGVTVAFSGRITRVNNITRSGFILTASSEMVLLGANMGPDVYQAGCLNQHYDVNCGLTATQVPGIVGAGATTTSFVSNLTNPAHFFDKGVLTFTSGANAGVKRAVQTYGTSGSILVAYELPFAPASADTFNVARGCLLTLVDCQAQRSLSDAMAHFRGQTFTPAAVNAITGLPGQ